MDQMTFYELVINHKPVGCIWESFDPKTPNVLRLKSAKILEEEKAEDNCETDQS